jgi:predicted solute-binding protein
MKILTEDLLREYGFMDNPSKTSSRVKIMTRNDFDVSIKMDGMYYSNLGFDYPLKDTATLRKVYKEVKNEELKLSV